MNCWYLSLGTPNRQLWLLKLGCWKIRAKLHFRDTQVNLGWGLFPGPMIIAGSLESAYSLNWGAREIWGQDLGTFMISRPI